MLYRLAHYNEPKFARNYCFGLEPLWSLLTEWKIFVMGHQNLGFSFDILMSYAWACIFIGYA